MKKLLAPMLLALSIFASGCAYSKVVAPLDTDVQETHLGSKVGRSSIHSVLFLFAWGDSGVAAAAQDGHITQVNHLDRESMVVLFGLYSRVTTIAYGD